MAAKPAMARQVEYWHPDTVTPYDRNPRTHSAAQIDKIAASISEYGFTNPILLDSHGTVIAGHGRRQAAQHLQLSQVPVIVLDHLDDAQRRALVIADNRLALDAGWDYELLASELGDLRAEDFDLSTIGFSDDELAELLGDKPGGGGSDESEGEGGDGIERHTFRLTGEQYEQVREAIDRAKEQGDFEGTGNPDMDGNALSFVCEMFVMANG